MGDGLGDRGPAEVGRRAVATFRRSLASRVIDHLQHRDPEFLDSLVELGLVRRGWVEEGRGPITRAEPMEVVERMLERSVERRPSLLASLGLSAIQVLSAPADDPDEEGSASRLAVAFTDLEGFTAYTSREGDEAASRLLADHHRHAGPVIRSRGGRIVKRLGDGLLLTFLEPEAAVLACLELARIPAGPLALRAGVHAGEVVVTRDDVIGHVVNVAARVAESARGGEVLVTSDVVEALGDSLANVRFGRLRRRRFKGVEDGIRVCRATLDGG